MTPNCGPLDVTGATPLCTVWLCTHERYDDGLCYCCRLAEKAADEPEDVSWLDLRVADGAREYRKTATVLAVQADVPFSVVTLEGVMRGERGDYLCQGPAGEKWPVKRAIFEATYRPVRE